MSSEENVLGGRNSQMLFLKDTRQYFGCQVALNLKISLPGNVGGQHLQQAVCSVFILLMMLWAEAVAVALMTGRLPSSGTANSHTKDVARNKCFSLIFLISWALDSNF